MYITTAKKPNTLKKIQSPPSNKPVTMPPYGLWTLTIYDKAVLSSILFYLLLALNDNFVLFNIRETNNNTSLHQDVI